MRRGLFLTVPVPPNGVVSGELAFWLPEVYRTLTAKGWDVVLHRQVGKTTCSSRNLQCHAALQSECDTALFIDNDAVPDMEGLLLLLDAIEKPEVDIVGGWSLMSGGKNPGNPVILGPADPEDFQGEEGPALPVQLELAHDPGLHEITGGGLGAHCLMVTRKVLEKFKARKTLWFEDIYYTDPEKDGGKYGTRRWGHDVLFCIRAAGMGFRVWVDSRVFWGHIKPVDLRDWYRINSELFEEINSHVPLVEAMRGLWGNDDFSAGSVFLMRMVYEAARFPEDSICVECGSGLTTAVLSRVLPPERLVVLEDRAEHATIARNSPGVNGVVYDAPLRDCGEYDWYTLPDLGGRKVGLVVCDGPRGSTRGGRYGALPQLKPHLASEFMVLLDDAHRPAEQATIDRWVKEYDLSLQVIEDGNKKFAVLFGRT
jgi:hypothetical protein